MDTKLAGLSKTTFLFEEWYLAHFDISFLQGFSQLIRESGAMKERKKRGKKKEMKKERKKEVTCEKK